MWYVGYAENWEQCLIEGDLGKQNFVAYYCANDHVMAVCSMGDSAVPNRVERFDRRGTEPFEPFDPFEFLQNRNFP